MRLKPQDGDLPRLYEQLRGGGNRVRGSAARQPHANQKDPGRVYSIVIFESRRRPRPASRTPSARPPSRASGHHGRVLRGRPVRRPRGARGHGLLSLTQLVNRVAPSRRGRRPRPPPGVDGRAGRLAQRPARLPHLRGRAGRQRSQRRRVGGHGRRSVTPRPPLPRRPTVRRRWAPDQTPAPTRPRADNGHPGPCRRGRTPSLPLRAGSPAWRPRQQPQPTTSSLRSGALGCRVSRDEGRRRRRCRPSPGRTASVRACTVRVDLPAAARARRSSRPWTRRGSMPRLAAYAPPPLSRPGTTPSASASASTYLRACPLGAQSVSGRPRTFRHCAARPALIAA